MRDFSIDLAAEQIHSSKTREYFQEVVRSYYSENYRSAIVMLYSVAQTDLILKLAELQNVYNDPIAKSILEDISKLQKEAPSKSDWETKLMKYIYERTDLLQHSDLLNLQNLQQQRHLCAHPVISESLELYSPNRETVRALMRNTLEGLLLKPAILSKKVFSSIMEDLEKNRKIIFNREDLSQFLESKYLSRLRETSIKQIFESLWRITFNDLSSKSVENREILTHAVQIFLARDFEYLKTEIADKNDYYSVIDESLHWELIDVLCDYPSIYAMLNVQCQLVLKKSVALSANLTAHAWFLKKDLKAHIDYLLGRNFARQSFEKDEYVDVFTILRLAHVVENQISKSLANKVLIDFFLKSRHYWIADQRFDNLIEGNLEKFTLEDFRTIVDGFELNHEIAGRRQAANSAQILKKYITKKYPEFDFTDCPSFV